MKVIMFDFDGVLIDSFEACFIGFDLQYVATREQYRDLYLDNFFESLERANFVKKSLSADVDLKKISLDAKSVLPVHEGMEEVVSKLSEKYDLLIITSSTEENVSKRLHQKGLKKYFSEVLGREISTSKVEKIKYVLDKYNVTPQDCTFVTDTVGDIKEAAQMNISSIAVSRGFHTPQQLQPYAAYLAASPQELETYLVK